MADPEFEDLSEAALSRMRRQLKYMREEERALHSACNDALAVCVAAGHAGPKGTITAAYPDPEDVTEYKQACVAFYHTSVGRSLLEYIVGRGESEPAYIYRFAYVATPPDYRPGVYVGDEEWTADVREFVAALKAVIDAEGGAGASDAVVADYPFGGDVDDGDDDDSAGGDADDDDDAAGGVGAEVIVVDDDDDAAGACAGVIVVDDDDDTAAGADVEVVVVDDDDAAMADAGEGASVPVGRTPMMKCAPAPRRMETRSVAAGGRRPAAAGGSLHWH